MPWKIYKVNDRAAFPVYYTAPLCARLRSMDKLPEDLIPDEAATPPVPEGAGQVGGGAEGGGSAN